MPRLPNGRLSAMMFLQFFIWGAWYTTVAVYMTHNGMETLTHWPFTVNPIAAIAAPFFLGLVADRYFATEKVLGVLHLLGGVVMLVVPQTTAAPAAFIGLLLLYNLFYMPTLGLANSLAFHHIADQEKQFPLIRVFGTVGWIVAGLFVSFGLAAFADIPERTALPLYTTAVASLLLGAFSFTLPHTPPPAAGERVSLRSIVGLDALKQLGSRPFYVFIAASLLISIPLAAYYNFTQLFLGAAGVENIAATQTLGQASEVAFMLLMPLFFARLGVKWMLVVGMGAWVVRYVLFALAAPDAVFWLIATGILLHGVCYDFFFVTGQIYVDKKSTPAVRGQAQGFLVLITYGVGMLIGALIGGNVYNRFLDGAAALTLDQWRDFWYIPAAFAAAVMVFFAVAFRDRVDDDTAPDVTAPSTPASPEHPGAPTVARIALLAALGAGAWSVGCAPAGDGTGRESGDSASSSESSASSESEVAMTAGEWITLFDGTDLSAWRGYRREGVPSGWRVEGGVLAFDPEGVGGDLITRDTFGDFELEVDWRVAPGSNSGIFYRGVETTGYIYETAPEMQVLDNAGHADGGSPLTSAGSNFGLYPVERDATRPVGEWNHARIVARGNHVEHWLNGEKVVEYELGGDDWLERVTASKFAAWPAYGRSATGHIGLQDHGNPVWFRNIRVRELEAPGG